MNEKVAQPRQIVILLPCAPLWRAREIVCTVYGAPGKHYVWAPGRGKMLVQWDAHMCCFAETRLP